MWEHKKYPKRTCRERFTPSRFKFLPLHWLVDVVSLPWAQASGWWLCCSHAETFLFTAVLADGGTPGAAARSIRPAELWTWTGNTELTRSSVWIGCFHFDCKHQISVSVSWPACGAVGQRRQEAALDMSSLVPLVQAVSLKLGHPNVEELVAFGLRETNIFTWGETVWKSVETLLPSCDREYRPHPDRCDMTSC